MTDEEHRRRHQALHQAMDALLADFIAHTPGPWLDQPIQALMEWSFHQTQDPQPRPGTEHDQAAAPEEETP